MNDGGPAFPQPQFEDLNYSEAWGRGMGGMSLRDWFAGQALQGMLAHSRGNPPHGYRVDSDRSWHEEISGEAYKIADAILKERCAESK